MACKKVLTCFFLACYCRDQHHQSWMTSDGVTSVKKSLPSLNLLCLFRGLHRVQVHSGSACPSMTLQYRPKWHQTHLTDRCPLTRGKVLMTRQHPFKLSPKDRSLPTTAGRQWHHQQVLVEKKRGRKKRLTNKFVWRRRVKIKKSWWMRKRRCRGVVEKQREEEHCRAAPCACWCSLLGKRCHTLFLCCHFVFTGLK